jgi:transposase-like protein
MMCPICLNPALRIGLNRKGRCRWACLPCNRTFTVRSQRSNLVTPDAARLLAGLALRGRTS